jgi:hypothetical protein|nr:MAG TPA: hypothetical protein [Caudoviricetes sp.]
MKYTTTIQTAQTVLTSIQSAISNAIQAVAWWLKERREAKAKAETASMVRESSERIQLQEFMGKVHISIDGIPLMPVDSLRKDAIPALEEVRMTYRNYANQLN